MAGPVIAMPLPGTYQPSVTDPQVAGVPIYQPVVVPQALQGSAAAIAVPGTVAPAADAGAGGVTAQAVPGSSPDDRTTARPGTLRGAVSDRFAKVGSRLRTAAANHPKLAGGLEDFASGMAVDTTGAGPLGAFMTGFAGATLAGAQRRRGDTAAAAAASQQGIENARADRTADREDRQEDRADRALDQDVRNDEYGNLRSEVEIQQLQKEAQQILTPDQVIKIEGDAVAMHNSLTSAGMMTPEEVTSYVNNYRANEYSSAMAAANGEDPTATPNARANSAVATAGASSQAPPISPVPGSHPTGIGTSDHPYDGLDPNSPATLDILRPGTYYYDENHVVRQVPVTPAVR